MRLAGRSRRMFAAAQTPDCCATEPSWGSVVAVGRRGCWRRRRRRTRRGSPSTVRSGWTSIRPPRPVGSPRACAIAARRLAAAPDHRPGRDARAVVELDPVGVHGGDAGLQPDLGTVPWSACRGRTGGPCRRTRRAGPCRGRPGRSARAVGAAQRCAVRCDQLGERPGHLDPGRPAADDDHVEGVVRGPAAPSPAAASSSWRCSRSRSASATEYSGNACSAAPGTPKKFGRAARGDDQV